jgi:hypothetical protein
MCTSSALTTWPSLTGSRILGALGGAALATPPVADDRAAATTKGTGESLTRRTIESARRACLSGPFPAAILPRVPSALTVESIEQDRGRISVLFAGPEFSHELAVTIDGADFTKDRDFLVPTMLLPAMRMGATASIGAPVSARLLDGARAVQDVILLWEDSYTRIEVDATERHESPPPAAGTGAFFSAGVDSFYTAVKHLDAITHLVFLENVFDPRVPDEETLTTARAAAAELGKPLLEVRANFRHLGDAAGVRHVLYHGSALAAIAHLLRGTVGRMLIGSTFSYDFLRPWGSHPLIDPLWSTESLEIVHDGAEATRPMKLARLAENEVAMRHLRVCQNRPLPGLAVSDRLNCGSCKKCLVTMTNLRAVGALGRCETLPDDLDLELVARMPIDDERDFARLSENLRAAGDRDPELAAALRTSLESSLVQDPVAAMAARRAAEKQVERQAQEIDALKRSLSWRVTAPLRAVARSRSG